MSRNTIFRDFGLEALSALPDKPRVVLLTTGDEVINSVRYAHRQLGARPNALVLDLKQHASGIWLAELARDL